MELPVNPLVVGKMTPGDDTYLACMATYNEGGEGPKVNYITQVGLRIEESGGGLRVMEGRDKMASVATFDSDQRGLAESFCEERILSLAEGIKERFEKAHGKKVTLVSLLDPKTRADWAEATAA